MQVSNFEKLRDENLKALREKCMAAPRPLLASIVIALLRERSAVASHRLGQGTWKEVTAATDKTESMLEELERLYS